MKLSRRTLAGVLAPIALMCLAIPAAHAVIDPPPPPPGGGSCADLLPGTTELRVQPVPVGSLNYPTDGTLTVRTNHYQSTGGWFFGWKKEAPEECEVQGVIVNGATGGNLYTYSAGQVGDNGLTVPADASGLFPAVAVANFCYVCPTTGDQGCTIGYWKNHLDAWAATGFAPGQSLVSVFGANALGENLQQALSYPGGPGVAGGKRLLLRQAVGALLSAAHSGVDYPVSLGTVVSATQAALATGNRAVMLELAADFDEANNLGCPLN